MTDLIHIGACLNSSVLKVELIALGIIVLIIIVIIILILI